MWKKKVSFLVLLVFLNSFALAWAEENGSGEETGTVTAEQAKESPEVIKEYIDLCEKRAMAAGHRRICEGYRR